MKDYNDFEKYYNDHIGEVFFDAIHTIDLDELSPQVVKDSADIAGIASAVTLSMLRQYHEWLFSKET